MSAAVPVEPLTERAIRLRDAVLTAVMAYGQATQDYGEASVSRTNTATRVQLLDEISDHHATILRLTRELAALDSGQVTR